MLDSKKVIPTYPIQQLKYCGFVMVRVYSPGYGYINNSVNYNNDN